MKLTKSKQFLADAIHASGKGWLGGALYAAQDKFNGPRIGFWSEKPSAMVLDEWAGDGWMGTANTIACDKLSPNWLQTILSRDEYFSAYPIEPPRPLPETFNFRCKIVEVPGLTIEQLAADYRAKQAEAIAKQKEADEATDAADAAFVALEKAMDALGFSVRVITEPVNQHDEWVEYLGSGDLPVPSETIVRVWLKKGRESGLGAQSADVWDWSQTGSAGDIVKYLIAE